MGIVGGYVADNILKRFVPRSYAHSNEISCKSIDTKLVGFFGTDFFEQIKGKVVIDFGCGRGFESVQMAKNGAQKVIGIDIQERLISEARELAKVHDIADCCVFASRTKEKADIIISKDAFEHFDHPDIILNEMHKLLNPNGYVLASFGPTWLHPYGGHLFSVFPWSHLIFTERSLINWRSKFRSDGATCFREVDGGLNRMTIKKFKRIVDDSKFKCVNLESIPIKSIKILKSPLLNEFGSSIIRCKLVPQ